MSRRKPSDTFTRFTSNSIHASQKPSTPNFSPRQPQGPTAAPASTAPIETPAEKVARLRAQLRSQRDGSQLTPTERFIAGGRRWADTAHRFTTVALLGLTGISAVVAVYGIFSLVTHSRRQKRAFIDAEMDRLRDAQQAFLRGDASAEQLHLLEQERAGEEMAAKWKADKDAQKTRGLWAKAKGMLGVGQEFDGDQMGTETLEEAERRQFRASGGRVLEEAWIQQQQQQMKENEPQLRRVAVREHDTIEGVGFDAKGRPVPLNKMERLPSNIKVERRTGDRPVEPIHEIRGGMLDQMADNAASAAASKTGGGWYSSWFSRKS
ncbi:uncharacterized protein AB675_6780 [Cyphellophora attinorum]|uniref:Uncharacterized protein n=1 Tax=Cyphellophora attinorum TaxID=1664694 RepID=A0A0N1HDV5_9EURO|nr:uncharacterized protein AB675_6780 [Phialophora attinorum]KPI43347.1 hypothetical protein AB675_6780 [Phialophora attinorum]